MHNQAEVKINVDDKIQPLIQFIYDKLSGIIPIASCIGGNGENESFDCYIYDINTFELFGESDCLTKASEMINNKHIGTYKRMKTMIYSNNYIISKIKFKNKIDLINYCYENFFF